MKEYIAQVISRDDPENCQRSQARVFEKFPADEVDDVELPWATHRKTGARLEFSEGGNFDMFTPQNGFVRAKNKLRLIGGESLDNLADLLGL